MQQNNNLKVTISKDFDKINNLKKIKERIEENNKMKNKNMIFKYLGGICCIALIVMGIILFNEENESKKIFDNGKDRIYVNKIKTSNQAKLDIDAKSLNIDENSNDIFKEFNLEFASINKELNESYSFLNDINIPTDLNNNKKYGIFVKEKKENEKYAFLNNYQFIYRNLINNREIIISFSKNFKPLRDYLIESDNNQESIINNIKLIIYQHEQTYMTKFKYKDINFDIETRYITEDEFISLLQSIIK